MIFLHILHMFCTGYAERGEQVMQDFLHMGVREYIYSHPMQKPVSTGRCGRIWKIFFCI